MIIAGKNFYFKNNTYIMGILNLTPDSFSDGSLYNNEYSSIKHAVKMVNDGASIIDIGCESTRPNCTKISEKNEIERFKKLAVPVIKEMKKLKIPISIDTYKPKVLKFALEFGIDILNDIWGFKYDETMAKLCYQYKIPCILMHNRTNENYENFEEDIINELNDSIKIAKKNCIKDNEIIIDPGIGFAKSHEQNLWIIKNIDKFKEFKLPLIVGVSKKRIIGNILNNKIEDRVTGTVTFSTYLALKKVGLLRVHDVRENYSAVKIVKEILKN